MEPRQTFRHSICYTFGGGTRVSRLNVHTLLTGACLALLFGCLAVTALWWVRSTSPYAVSGPEATDLVQEVTGYIVVKQRKGEIIAWSLPDLRESRVRPPVGDGGSYIRAVSGPNREGFIAFIEGLTLESATDKKNTRRHLLKTIRIDGSEEREVFSRPGDPLWDHVVGWSGLTLAPVGSRVAFLSQTKGAQMFHPQVLCTVGSLEIWHIGEKSGRATGITALDTRMSWFPDGRRLAYVELVSRQAVRLSSPELQRFVASYGRWPQLPAVHVLDVDTGEKTFLHVGENPVVSADGSKVLVYNFDTGKRLVDVATGQSEAVDWPGDTDSGAFALLQGGLVLYMGQPTAGTPLRYTEFGTRPRLLWPLKVAHIESGGFQTVVPYVDAYDSFSFGLGKPPQ